ncbi:hypothetical protein SAMN05421858_4326 [Haladaptatus litoreus]|uniref:Uncharacterized protein n=1 Tax=Haladaptatus litoreus TaxID=553468 RepID=A0A1N7EK23_9EURY|nr:hypothetical protein [Haladaptatus litoreus]SIR88463.1 hypothetical protein SAMN05421858_4326 [Haladaptatus litoreus]
MPDLDARWDNIDSWWDCYVREQESGLIELRERLDSLNKEWEQSTCAYDDDPLVGDWTETNPQDGPLRTNQEENWSQWLAHLLRDSMGDYCAELLGPLFDTSPTYVRRERAYHDEELHDRRVDILAEFGQLGMTIEVKIGDEHYEKTPQTAYLTEKHHQRDLDWTHYLLLPRSKENALQGAFGERLKDSDEHRPRITATAAQERDITVIYWSEVAQALRRTLLADVEPSTHWAGSAYLFITLIEEQILRFYALPSLEAYRASSFGISDIERFQSIDPDDQLAYLDNLLEEITHG